MLFYRNPSKCLPNWFKLHDSLETKVIYIKNDFEMVISSKWGSRKQLLEAQTGVPEVSGLIVYVGEVA